MISYHFVTVHRGEGFQALVPQARGMAGSKMRSIMNVGIKIFLHARSLVPSTYDRSTKLYDSPSER